jgi:hypothetical protein
MSVLTARAAACSAAVLVAAAAASAPAQAASSLPSPATSAVTVRHSGALTVPMHCAATPVLRTAGAQVAGRCEQGRAARFQLSAATLRALRTPRPATIRAGASGTRLRLTSAVRGQAASVSGLWRDATLDCYPPGGGMSGGGTYSNSVALTVNWRSDDGALHYGRHVVFYEEYWNGSGPYYSLPDGSYANTSSWIGPFQFSPNGILGQSVPTYGVPGSITGIQPWIDEQTYPKSVHIQVRAQVGLEIWNGSAWGAPVYHYANPVNAALGYATGICALN